MIRVHYGGRGTHPIAIDYANPDEQSHHLLFEGLQVFMFTLEEVENYATSLVKWSDTGRAAIVRIDRSPWIESFGQYHLKNHGHYRVMFCDQFLDVICQGIQAHPGRYLPHPAP